MSEPRVAPLGLAEAQGAATEAGAHESLAGLPYFRVLLRLPRTARAQASLFTSLLAKGQLSPRLRELAIMRLGWITGSAVEWSQHWPISIEAGIPAAHLLAIREWEDAAVFDDADRSVLAAVDATVNDGALPEPQWRELVRRLGEDLAMETVAVIATWWYVSVLARSLAIPLPEEDEPWPPDGVVPEIAP